MFLFQVLIEDGINGGRPGGLLEPPIDIIRPWSVKEPIYKLVGPIEMIPIIGEPITRGIGD